MKTKSTHGGSGRDAGRTSADGRTGKARCVKIDAESLATLKAYGDGELSLGVRRAADLVRASADEKQS
jgi:archaeosine-15-forming tRNA-guanine transglycosylase